MMKRCTKCGEMKDVSQFSIRKDRRSGIRSACKQCERTRSIEKAKRLSKNWKRSEKTYWPKYYEKHGAELREKARAWRKTESGKRSCRVSAQNRIFRENEVGGQIKVEDVQQVYEENIKKYGTLTCELCFKPVTFGDDSIDHKVPVSRREEFPNVEINGRSNLQVAHLRCNCSKKDKTVKEWFDGIGGGIALKGLSLTHWVKQTINCRVEDNVLASSWGCRRSSAAHLLDEKGAR